MATPVVSDSIERLSSTPLVHLEGALLVQHGRPLLLTAVRAQDFHHHARVDMYDPRTGTGYQRDRSELRVRGAAKYYAEGGRMPNPILANVREDDFPNLRVVITSGDRDAYDAAVEEGGEWIGAAYVEMPPNLHVWVYDGQHREGGIASLLGDQSDFGDFPVPLSLTLGLSTGEEMKEFYEVNTHAKSVKTDLAWELLRQMAREDPDLAEQLDSRGKTWITQGIEVARALRDMPGPWKDHIQAPNQKKVRNDDLTIPEAEFVRSIRGLVEMPLFQNADPRTIAQVINAYWTGIAKVLPELFDPMVPSKEWVIQKGVGTFPLHRVLPRVIEVVRARGQRLGDADAYADVMKRLVELRGEVTDEETGETQLVTGANYWKAGRQGVASGLVGEVGRKRLYITIRALVPKPTEEISL